MNDALAVLERYLDDGAFNAAQSFIARHYDDLAVLRDAERQGALGRRSQR